MTNKEKAKQRSQMLKEVREAHKETVERTQEYLKKQKKIHREINKVIKEGPKTVPEISEANGLESHVVLWNLTAMKKYGAVVEAGMSGEYFQYGKAEEKN